MNRKRTDDLLRRYIGRFGKPPETHVEAEIDRAWRDLQAATSFAPEADIASDRRFHSRPRFWRFVLVSAAVVAAAVLLWKPSPSEDVRVVETVDGDHKGISVERVEGPIAMREGQAIELGQTIRGRDGAAGLVLQDGSLIEMNAQSEFVLEKAGDGVRIRLSAGNIIVTAAKQRSGHLYVQTKDVTVSVVGTVFMVNAAKEGSRVAVIDGEVEVRHGNSVKKLLPGEQVATGASMIALPVEANIAWSGSATAHLALLQQSTANRPATPKTLRFAADSIKLHDPALPLIGSGFGCRGIDGKRLAPFHEGGEPPFVIPLGRCVGAGVAIPELIAFAYDRPHRYAPGTPDWASTGTLTTSISTDNPTGTPRTIQSYVKARFQIDAVAENPSAVTTAELKQMVQTMLTERFKVRSHLEMEALPGYAVTVGSSPKLKEASGDPTPLLVDMTTPGRPVLRGKSTLDQFLVFIMGFTNPSGYSVGELPAYIANMTRLAGIYEWEFVLPIPGGDGRGGNSTPPAPGQPVGPPSANRYAWRAPAMAAAMESQLGLRMQPQQIPVEILIVEHIEKPSAN